MWKQLDNSVRHTRESTVQGVTIEKVSHGGVDEPTRKVRLARQVGVVSIAMLVTVTGDEAADEFAQLLGAMADAAAGVKP